MKKLLLSLISVLCVLTANAQKEITFSCATDNVGNTAGDNLELSKEGVTIFLENGLLGSSNYRIYKGKKLTISSGVGNISKIEFTCTASGEAQYGPGCFEPQDGYSYTDKIGTWEGASQQVQFLAKTNQVRATKIVVTINDNATVPTIEKPTFSLANGTYKGAQSLTITGPEGYGIIYTTDEQAPADGVGTKVEKNTTTISVEKSTVIKAIAFDIADPDNISYISTANITIINEFNTAETPMTVKQAREYIQKGENLDYYVFVKGKVKNIIRFAINNNANYSIIDENGTDTLYVFSGLGLDNKKWVNEDDIMAGDEVTVYGTLTDYVKDGVSTYEFNSGNYIVKQTKVDRTPLPDIVGEGTLSKPYTIVDIKTLSKKGELPTEAVWVKGTIAGVANTTNGALITLDKIEGDIPNTNLCISEDANTMPVQIPTAVREALNLRDNNDNVGKDVYVYGKIETYCGTIGVKSTSDYSWDGITSSVLSVETDINSKAVRYSISGQKVDASYKGITVQKGKKTLVK